MTSLGYQNVPTVMTNADEHRRQIATALNATRQGKMNVTLDVTLNPSVTTTVIHDSRIGATSAISPAMPTTAAGAAALAAGIYVDTVTPPIGATLGSATIHHASNASATQTIRFSIIG